MSEPTAAYTGQVNPGGPVDVRELAGLTIRKLAVSSMHNNVYLLTSRATGAQLLIDAAAEPERVTELIASGGPSLEAIVTTHRHADHTRALAQITAETGARTLAGADDADDLPIAVDRRLSDGDTITFGDITLDVIHLRGHTPGSIALAYDDPDGHTHLFTGDSLFPGGVGNTKDEGQDFDSLIEDVSTRVFDRFDDDTWFYPGHGDDSTLGAQRPHLQEWRDRGW